MFVLKIWSLIYIYEASSIYVFSEIIYAWRKQTDALSYLKSDDTISDIMCKSYTRNLHFAVNNDLKMG